jgi:hypothetical protein
MDSFSKQPIAIKDEFIESLTHDSVIVQLPELKNTHRNSLETALRIFEPGKVHEVSINEEDYPQEYREIIRRLIKALAEPNLRQTMDIEDEILDDLENKERLIEKQGKLIEETRQLKEEAILKEREQRKQKEEAILKETEQRKQKEEALIAVKLLIQNLINLGKSVTEIAQILAKPESEITELLK